MQSISLIAALFCVITFISNAHYSHAIDLNNPCSTCRQIADNFSKGFDKTSKKNFGGGNTAWEERKLSKYETSEIRLVEILEGLCDSSNFECNHMLEEHEEHFETWWFKRKTKHPDLFKWFCIDTVEVCCPKGTFGPDCNACVGGSERPCHGNGACDGDGTRAGHGRCSCNHGYRGDFCVDCAEGFFNEERNDTYSLCTECHTSCKTCSGLTNRDCGECKPGWEKGPEGSCNDVDECSNEPSQCSGDQYCLNTDGSYSCRACDQACSGCIGEGPGLCLTCASGYQDEDRTCVDIDECSLPEQVCRGENLECVNVKGSYKCFCSTGFQELDGVCVEITPEESKNEASSNPAELLTTHHLEEHEDL